MQFLKPILFIVAALLLFFVVLPGNHSEAEDAFEYSRLIEEGQGAELFHPHHLLYLPTQKIIFNAAQAAGYTGRSYGVARAVSMLAGAVSLGLFFLMAVRLQSAAGVHKDRRLPWLATVGLLSTYGFIRYACEVEIYIPAMALMLAALYSALRAEESRWWFAAGIIFSGWALLLHTLNAATALGIIPLLYILNGRRWKQGALHLVVTLTIVGSVYCWVQLTCGTYCPATDTATEGWLQSGTVMRAVVGLGQCTLSANFLFAYEGVAEYLQKLFPYRVLAEEIFAGSHIPGWLKVLAPVSFVLSLAAGFGVGVFLFMATLRRRRFNRTSAWLILWLGGTMLPTLILEPSNPELWVLSLAPLWMLFLGLTVQLPLSARTVTWLVVAVGIFASHNLLAGMGSVRSRAGDYNVAKGAWVLEQAQAGDVIHTADSFVFTFYLDYWSVAEVRNLNTQSWVCGRKTFVFGDVFDPPSAIGVRYPEQAERVAEVAAELRPLCRKVYSNPFGGVWIVDDEAE